MVESDEMIMIRLAVMSIDSCVTAYFDPTTEALKQHWFETAEHGLLALAKFVKQSKIAYVVMLQLIDASAYIRHFIVDREDEGYLFGRIYKCAE